MESYCQTSKCAIPGRGRFEGAVTATPASDFNATRLRTPVRPRAYRQTCAPLISPKSKRASIANGLSASWAVRGKYTRVRSTTRWSTRSQRVSMRFTRAGTSSRTAPLGCSRMRSPISEALARYCRSRTSTVLHQKEAAGPTIRRMTAARAALRPIAVRKSRIARTIRAKTVSRRAATPGRAQPTTAPTRARGKTAQPLAVTRAPNLPIS